MGTGIGPKKKVFGNQAPDYRQPDLFFVVVRMAPPDSFRQKGTASFRKESSCPETVLGFHASKDFDLDLFSVGARIEGPHRSIISFAFNDYKATQNHWSPRTDLNRQPADYKSAALPLSYVGQFIESVTRVRTCTLERSGAQA